MIFTHSISDIKVILAEPNNNTFVDVKGKIINGSRSGIIPQGLEVILLVIDSSKQEIVESKNIPIGTDGTFSFNGVRTGGDLTHRVVVDYGKYTPYQDIEIDPENNPDPVILTIYDKTTNFDGISISNYSMLIPSIDQLNRIIGVLAVINIVNSSDEVWIPDIDNPNLTGLDLLRFNLPEGFKELFVESNLPTGNVLQIGTGFALTNPVPPGEYNILISYLIDYQGESLNFPFRLPYGAEKVTIMLPEDSGNISGQGLSFFEKATINEAKYNSYGGTNYDRGGQLNVQFRNLPEPNITQKIANVLTKNGHIITISIGTGGILIGLLIYASILHIRRSNRAVNKSRENLYDFKNLKRSEFVAMIASLDDLYSDGNISRNEYLSRRDALKQAAIRNQKLGHS